MRYFFMCIVLNVQDPYDSDNILVYNTDTKTVSLVNESDKENNDSSSSDLYYFI